MKARKLYGSVLEQVRSYETALEQANQQASKVAQKQLRATQAASEALAVIAHHRLAEGVMVGGDIQKLLQARVVAERQLRSELGEVESRIAAQAKAVEGVVEQVDQAQRAVQGALRDYSQYAALLAQLEDAAARQSALQDSHKAVQAECARKLPAYQNDALYQYLVTAGYGTPDYQRQGIIQRLDGWIAGLCHFSENKQNEQMLQLMRQESKKLVAGAQAKLAELEAQLVQVTESVEVAHQLPALRERHQRASANLAEYKGQANHLHSQLKAFAAMEDEYYRQARQSILKLVTDEPLELLAERSALTDAPADDAAVQRLKEAREVLGQLRREAATAQAKVAEAQAQFDRIKKLQRTLRTYETTSSYEFRSGLDLPSILTGYMAGTLSEREAVRSIERYRSEVDSGSYYSSSSAGSYGSSRSSSSWGSSSSSSDSSFSSSDSFGGSSDSYSTSDSF